MAKRRKTYVNKQTRKTAAKKKSSRIESTSRPKNTGGRKAPKTGNKKHKEPAKKIPVKNKATASNRSTAGKKATAKGTTKTQSAKLFTAKQKRGSKRIDFSFGKTKDVNKKIDAFESQSDKAIKNELRKRGGKPPRGIIVIVTDKDGNEKTFVSPLDFVVNKENVKNFVTESLQEMRDNFMMWQKMKKHMPKSLQKEMKEQGYGDYDPDDIEEITIKFII